MLKYLTNVPTNATSEPDSTSDQSSNSNITVVAVDENNNNSSDHKSMKSYSNKSKTKAVPVWQDKWLRSYGNWLSFDSEKNIMFCSLCKEHSFKNTVAMAMGTNNFKTTTIDRHIVSNDHKTALSFPKAKQDLDIAIANAESKEETSIMLCMKVVYFMSVEGKYPKFLMLLKELDNPNLDALKIGENIDYSSYTTACDLLDALSKVIDKTVAAKLKTSPFVTIMTDESTDITVYQKLVINARIVDTAIDLSRSQLQGSLGVRTGTWFILNTCF